MTRIHRTIFSTLFLAFTLSFSSCNLFKEDEEPTEKTAHDHIYEKFNLWYLWQEELPAVDPNSLASYSELIDTLKVDVDRWSFVASLEALMSYLDEAETKSYGVGFVTDIDRNIRVSHVYEESPMGKFGVKRAWILSSINGYGSDNIEKMNEAYSSDFPAEFTFIDHEGNSVTETFAPETFAMNTVLHSSITVKDGHKIGYLVFDAFLNTSEEELEREFEKFEAENITDLIVDFRYNGGGSTSIAEMLVGMIGGKTVDGQIISNTVHNNQLSSRNHSTTSNYDGPIVTIDKVYFIATEESASASELVINALEPFMDVQIIGSTTHGKPVGMYVLQVEEFDLAILPISLKITNADGYGDYYNGLPADIFEIDDVTHDWGNENEAMFRTAVTAIVDPNSLAISAPFKSGKLLPQRLFEPKQFNFMIKEQ